ncbi:hypothetical protein [Jiangella asiatica]|uniref:Uncharacterized protein n=1 Tax=Jiangella asiatica TaxID=2530372 RepID=A0A4R5CS95_9ACTN|nr:hypothetical protein [Jiangella asiatica]TDE03449.1 hypothetical protein E1269_20650 [Jiangella asiatica]
MNQVECARLAAAVNHYRPEWPQASLLSFITKNLAARAYRDAAVALTWVATDPATETPARVLENGPWWVAARADEKAPTPDNSVAGKCPRCPAWTIPGDGHACTPAEPTEAYRRARADLAAHTTDSEETSDG